MTDTELRTLASLIKRSKKILLTTHINPDGDGIGSGLALMNEFLKMGKKVDFINRDPLPEIYRFLPNSSRVKHAKKTSGYYDLAIILECPELSRNGNITDFAKQARYSVNIDHHLGNTMYGDLNIVDPKAAAVGVQLYKIMKRLGYKIGPEVATCIYTSIITDTGSFRYSNTTPEVHHIAADLLRLGADPEYISSEVYASTAGLFCAFNSRAYELFMAKVDSVEHADGYAGFLFEDRQGRAGAQDLHFIFPFA